GERGLEEGEALTPPEQQGAQGERRRRQQQRHPRPCHRARCSTSPVRGNWSAYGDSAASSGPARRPTASESTASTSGATTKPTGARATSAGGTSRLVAKAPQSSRAV